MADPELRRMQARRGTAAQWAANDVTLKPGEIGIEIVDGAPWRAKIGDGTSAWSALPYMLDSVVSGDEAEQLRQDVAGAVEASAGSVQRSAVMRSALDHGIVADGTTNNKAAIEALQPGTYFFPKGIYAVGGASKTQIPGLVNLLGEGIDGTVFKCLTPESGLAFSNHAPTGNLALGGTSQGFTVDGNLVATEALYLGVSVGRTFIDVKATRANGTGVYLDGAQNNVFIGLESSDHAGSCLVFDMGCGSNRFYRTELNSPQRYCIEFLESGKFGSNQIGSVNIANRFEGGMEYMGAQSFGTKAGLGCVRHTAGVGNMLDGPFMSDADRPAAGATVLMEQVASGVGNGGLRICDTAFSGSTTKSSAIEIASNVESDTAITFGAGNTFSAYLNGFKYRSGVSRACDLVAPVRAFAVQNWLAHADGAASVYEPYLLYGSGKYGVVPAATLGTVVGKKPVYDSAGQQMGFVPVYSSIS